MSSDKRMTVSEVQIYLDSLNVPLIHPYAQTYQKGDMFCVYETQSNFVFKYPIQNIFRVKELYGASRNQIPRDMEDE